MLHQEPYWTGYKCGETNPFLLFWFYLIYVIFVIDLYPVYTPYVLGCLFFYINKSLLLIKNKNKNKKINAILRTHYQSKIFSQGQFIFHMNLKTWANLD